MGKSSTRRPEELRRELVRQWLARAEEDFGVACQLIADEHPYLNAVAFHCQQSAEKFLKAVLVERQLPFPKTHNLGELLDLISGVNPKLSAKLGACTVLNPYAIQYRYPSDAPGVSLREAKDALETAKEVRKAVNASLSAKVDRIQRRKRPAPG